MYKRLTRSRIRVERESSAYLGLEIISKIILQCIHVTRAPVYAYVEIASPAYLEFEIFQK